MILLVFISFLLTGVSTNFQILESSNYYHELRLERKEAQLQKAISYELKESKTNDAQNGFKNELISRGVFPSKINVVYNWCNENLDPCNIDVSSFLPKDGFNVMATANTKVKGSEDGRFIGTNILNEAFLERFAITIEQPYPASSVEQKIVLGSMKKYGTVDEDFAKNLVTWSEVIRKTFFDGGVDELISTRRLDHIAKSFSIFKDKKKSIELCVARFDDDTKDSFLDLYSKIDAGINPLEEKTEEDIPTEEPQF